MADRMSAGAVKFLARFSRYTSVLAIGFGMMVLTGWTFHIQRLKGLIPGQVAVKANTAICFVLLGTALWLATSGVRKRFARPSATLLSLLASFIGLLSFLEYWKAWDLGIDQLLFRAGADDLPGTVRAGLMSPISAVDFFLLGIAIALLNVKARWVRPLQSMSATVAAVAAMCGVLDFVLDPQKTHTHIAPMTALVLFLFSLVVLCTRSDWGLGALLVSRTVGGVLCRRLLPSALLIPIVIAWLRWKGQQAGFYSEWTGLAIMTVSAAVLLGGLTLWTALVLDRTETRRQESEESAQRLAAIVTSSNDAIIGKTLDGIVTSWNPGAEAIYGYSAEEMVGHSVTRIVPPDLLAEFEEFLSDLQRGETIRHYETERIRNDGKRISVSISTSPVRDEKGRIAGASTITRDISERRHAEENVRKAAHYVRSLIEASLDPLVTISKEGKITDVNDATEKATGFARDRLMGSDFCDYFTEPEKARQGYRQVFTEGFVRDYPLAIRHTSGQVIEVLYNATVFRNEAGAVEGVFAAARDVTERKRAEEEVRKAARYSRSLIEASMDPLVTISKEGKITDVNDATEKATGLARDRLIGSDFCDYFTEPEKARQGYRQVFTEGFVRDYALAIRHTSGQVIEVLYNATVFRNEAGAVEGVFAAARDVTERKQAEEEIRTLNRELEERVEQRTAQLRESETRVRRKLDAILSPEADLGDLELADILDIAKVQSLADDFYQLTSIPMFILNLNTKPLIAAGWQKICTDFHRIHPEACKNCQESDTQLTHGVAPGEFRMYKCKNNMWDGVTPLTLAGKHVGNLFIGQFFFDDEPVDEEIFRVQCRHYGFDEGKYMQVLHSVPRLSRSEVKTGTAFLTKFAELLSQLSYSSIQLARSTEQAGRTNMELAAANKELEAFTYSVSHDLRAPLRHISGFSKILAEEFAGSLPSEAQHHVQRIEEGTRRMGQLVDDLLNLGRVGRCEPTLQVAGLRSIVDEVIHSLKSEIGDRQVEWKIADLPYVECDPALMRQVFQNLLANALKFTRPRAQAVIEIGQEQRDGNSAVYVRDNGVGFSMKYVDKLFGVFQRLHRQEDFEGTGVGLATVQRIIQKHGGRVWAEAELDKGAAFYFTLGASGAKEPDGLAASAGSAS